MGWSIAVCTSEVLNSHLFSTVSKEARFISVGSIVKCSADSDADIKLLKFPSFLIVN